MNVSTFNEEQLIKIIQDRVENEITISSDTILYTIGISSFDIITILCELEENFGITIGMEAGMDIETVHDLFEYIVQNQSNA